ncbi:hypothetical protein B5S31_g1912 [[Candida] boidinii]|nr:hypothetical protein B5S29_g264 [[Candida] boidinii]OWB72205.1 hypothetical protein B5S31_g1912 [[Candida] boidinii]
MSQISRISPSDVHRITSGQVIVDLTSSVKELVENSIDANASKIHILFKNYGLDSIEVSDNGTGISETEYENICLKHYTSKLSSFEGMVDVETLGFRGEAMSSLCAIADCTITTSTKSLQPKAHKLVYDKMGKLESKSTTSGGIGTIIRVSNLFHNLPVRRKDFNKNHRREFQKTLNFLQSYLIICPNVRFLVENIDLRNKRNVLLTSNGSNDMLTAIKSVYGSNSTNGLEEVNIDLHISTRFRLKNIEMEVKVCGYISNCSFGQGRSASDRQLFFINKRPVTLQKFAKAINEEYKTFNHVQYPTIILNIEIDNNLIDINVTPDKRTVLLQNEPLIIEDLREELNKLFSSQDIFIPKNGQLKVNNRETKSYQQMSLTEFSSKDKDSDSNNDSASNDDDFTRANMSQIIRKKIGSTEREKIKVVEKDDEEGEEGEGEGEEEEGEEEEEEDDDDDGEEKRNQSQLEASSLLDNSRENSKLNDSSDLKPSITNRIILPTKSANRIEPESQVDIEHEYKNIPQADDECVNESPISRHDSLFVLSNSDSYSQSSVVIETDVIPDIEEHEIDSELNSSITHPESIKPMEIKATHHNDLSHLKFNSSVANTLKERHIEDEELVISHGDQILTSKVFDSNKYGVTFTEPEVRCHSHPTSHPQDELGHHNIAESGEIRTDHNGELDDYFDLENQADALSDNQPRPAKRNCITIDSEKSTHNLESTLHFDYNIVNKYSGIKKRKILNSSNHNKTGKYLSKEKVDDVTDSGAERMLTLTVAKYDFLKMRIIGQFNLGFILVSKKKQESDDFDLFIIDQHASDEKFNFEKYSRETVFKSQPLVIPTVLDLNVVEELIVINNPDLFEKNGFKIQVDESLQPGNRVKLLSLPYSKDVIFGLDDFNELIHLVKESDGRNNNIRPTKTRAMFAMRACRSSIMIGKPLNFKTMLRVVRNLAGLDKPWNCPHGRPTMRHLIELSDWKCYGEDTYP